MHFKFLGTGTSQGVPPIGCTDPVCLSDDPKDKRLRSSAIITTDNNQKILIDCGPDFRQQMLTNHESHVDALLVTHEHNDHMIGMDDLRPLIFMNHHDMPVYCKDRTATAIIDRFSYAFSERRYPGAPAFDMHIIQNQPFLLFGIPIIPISVTHYLIDIYGYKIKNLAYITDMSSISDQEKEKLQNLDFLIVNCLRRKGDHKAHLILPQVQALVEELKPKQTYLTHMSHEMGFHADMCKEFPSEMQPGYDGLEFDF